MMNPKTCANYWALLLLWVELLVVNRFLFFFITRAHSLTNHIEFLHVIYVAITLAIHIGSHAQIVCLCVCVCVCVLNRSDYNELTMRFSSCAIWCLAYWFYGGDGWKESKNLLSLSVYKWCKRTESDNNLVFLNGKAKYIAQHTLNQTNQKHMDD